MSLWRRWRLLRPGREALLRIRKRLDSLARRMTFGHFLLLLAVAQGFWYANFVPPWWNYDEPRHFWLAWTLTRGDITRRQKKRVVRSLLNYAWFQHYPRDMWPSEKDVDRIPSLMRPTPRPEGRLLYWRIITLPWYLVPASWDVAWQLRILRWMTVLFFVATAWALWKASQEFFGKEHPLSRLVPLFTVLLPGFAEPMSLVNDDAGAALGGTLFLWASLRLIRRGFRWDRFLALLAAAWLAQAMKRTTVPLLAILPVVVLFSFRWRWRGVPWMLLGGGALAVLLTTFRWGDPAYWYYDRPWEMPLRVPSPQAQDGEWVFRLPPETEMGQWIPRAVYNSYPEGAEWVLSFWMWAEKPGEVTLPRLCVGHATWGAQLKGQDCTPAEKARLSTEPRRFQVVLPTIQGDFPRVEFPPHDAGLGMVYIDDVILESPDGQRHIIRNGSAEAGWWGLNPWFLRFVPGWGSSPNVALAALQYPHIGQVALYLEASFLLKTAWGFFARAKIPYLGQNVVYGFLLLWGLVGILGCGMSLVRKQPPCSGATTGILIVGLFLVLGSVLLFPLGRLHASASLLTWFRYAFPVIFPFSALLVSGWYHLLGPRRAAWIVRFAAWLNLLAVWSIADFFYPTLAGFGYVLLLVVGSWFPLEAWRRFLLRDDHIR